MKVSFIDSQGAPDAVEIEAALERLNIHPSGAFLELVSNHNGASLDPNTFYISANNSSGVNRIIAIEKIAYETSLIDPVIAESFFPFAYAEGGNYLCLSKKSQDTAVYFLDHEIEGGKALTKVANSLNEFFSELEPIESSGPVKSARIKSVWIDPAFLKELQDKRRS